MRKYFTSLTLFTTLLFVAISFSAPTVAIAREQVSVQEYNIKVEAFNHKLDAAKHEKVKLDSTKTCLENRTSELNQVRGEREVALGVELAKKNQYEHERQVKEAEYKNFDKNYKIEANKYKDVQYKLNHARDQVRYNQAVVRGCQEQLKRDLGDAIGGLTGGLCKPAQDIGNLFSGIKNYENELPAYEKRARIAKANAEDARNNYNNAKTAYDRTNLQYNETQGEIKRLSDDVTKLKSDTAKIRPLIQPFDSTIVKFDKAIMEAKEVHTEENRNRALRTLDFLSKDIDNGMNKAHSAIQAVKNTYQQEGWPQACGIG